MECSTPVGPSASVGWNKYGEGEREGDGERVGGDKNGMEEGEGEREGEREGVVIPEHQTTRLIGEQRSRRSPYVY